ncbi:L-asparagine oxygenase [Photorhabdus australis subsp. thailandensis]|uniref:L-asparagine oxygenase n=1 Tax=Photorhabdus australis subsp. thailandensis TaxID=2805096 RepID=A0A1C0U3H3_9GAMM|nr:TauD/TfdA family dioxygenase [Photorhabdus australis]OCQ52472.1 L-asparagine oxygenase [Photorhabdus australis subsp. thailandensis]
MKISITQKVSNLWKNELCKITTNSPTIDDKLIFESKKIAEKFLPNIQELQYEINYGKGYIQFSNIPIDKNIPSYPTDGKRSKEKELISELSILGISSALGFHPFSYKQEKDGALVHEIVPIKSKENTASSNGSIEFDYHTDAAYLNREIRPQTLTLICLVDKYKTGTKLASLREALKKISKDEIETLMSDLFIHFAPATFNIENKKVKTSVLDRINGSYEIKVAFHNTIATNEKAQKALSNLRNAIDNIAIIQEWVPGDLVIFNNLRCVHGRGEVKGERWLQRCYGSSIVPTASVLELIC